MKLRNATRRRRSSILLVAVFAAIGMAVGQSGVAVAGSEQPTIGFVNGGSDGFYRCLEKGMKAAAKKSGATVRVVSSDEDPQKEQANVEDMLAQGVDALVLQTVDADSGQQAIRLADEAGVPLVGASFFFSSPEQVAGAAVFDVEGQGEELGKYVAKQAGDESADVAIIGGAPGGAPDLYNSGFENGIEGSSASVVFNQSAFWDPTQASSVAENLVQAHPDIDWIFVHNEDMAFAVARVLRTAGLEGEAKIVTLNGTPKGIKALRAGEFNAIVPTSPDQIGTNAGTLASEFASGETPDPNIIVVPSKLLTKGNAKNAPRYCR